LKIEHPDPGNKIEIMMLLNVIQCEKLEVSVLLETSILNGTF